MKSDSQTPLISVIIPVYNSASTLRQCLEALLQSPYQDMEVIVVDDGSTDQSLSVAKSFPCQVIASEANRGPAAARNLGASVSKAAWLFFLDADILVEPETITQVAQTFHERPEISAFFCSYQKGTIPTNFFSVYKNYVHYYTHQISSEDATTFCSGYGGIKREVFLAIGGFDEHYRNLEDIEMGYRLHQAGHRILLRKDIQLTHCKHYSLKGLITSDLFQRAIPWTKIMLDKRIYRADLNTRVNNVLSVPVAFLILFVLPFIFINATFLLLFIGLWIAFCTLNIDFYRLVFRERGVWFTAKTILMNWFTYIYSGIGLLMGVMAFLKTGKAKA